MDTTTRILRNTVIGIGAISVACFVVTAAGGIPYIAPSWATWYLGLFATMALVTICLVASIGYIVWEAVSSVFRAKSMRENLRRNHDDVFGPAANAEFLKAA